MPDYLSRAVYPSVSGATADFQVTFPYLLPEHVKPYLRAPNAEVDDAVVMEEGVDFEWTSSSVLHFLPGHLPPAGYELSVTRETPLALLENLTSPAVVSSAELNSANVQLLYLAQEAADKATDAAALLARTIRVPIDNALDQLPTTDRAGKFLAFTAGGQPSYSRGTGADAGLREDLAAEGGFASIGTRVDAMGAIPEGLERVLDRDPIAVESFGLASSGDRTLMWENALAASSLHGRPLVFSGTHDVQTLEIPNGTIIRSYGSGTVNILDDGTEEGRALLIDGKESILFEGFGVRSTAVSRTGLYGNVMILGGAEDITLSRMDFGVSPSAAVWSGGESKRLRILRCNAHDTFADAFHFTRGCEDITVFDTDVWDCGDDGIAFIAYTMEGATVRPAMKNCRALYCRVRNSIGAGSGIKFLGVHGGLVVGCEISGTVLDGVAIAGGPSGDGDYHYSRDITVRDTTIRNVSTGGSGRLISVQNSRNVRLLNNDGDGCQEAALGLFGVVVDLEVAGGRYGGSAAGRLVEHVQMPSTSPELIQQLFTDYGDTGVTEALSRNLHIDTNLFHPSAAAQTAYFAGASGKLIKGVRLGGNIQVRQGAGSGGAVFAYCDKPVVEVSSFKPWGSGSKSTGASVQFSACVKPRLHGGDNELATETGALFDQGTTDFDVLSFRSESGVTGILTDNNAMSGMISNSWLRSNTTALGSCGGALSTGNKT